MMTGVDALPLTAFNVGTEKGGSRIVLTLYGDDAAGAKVEIATVIMHPDAAGQLADALLDPPGSPATLQDTA
jgi:hypothetical protein